MLYQEIYMTEQKIDLAAEGLLKAGDQPTQSQPDESPSEEDFIEYVNKLLLGLQDSMGSLHIGIRVMNERISLLEKYVGYFLEKDPVLGEKIKAMAKARAEEIREQESKMDAVMAAQGHE
jgi:hypothetical protein